MPTITVNGILLMNRPHTFYDGTNYQFQVDYQVVYRDPGTLAITSYSATKSITVQSDGDDDIYFYNSLADDSNWTTALKTINSNEGLSLAWGNSMNTTVVETFTFLPG